MSLIEQWTAPAGQSNRELPARSSGVEHPVAASCMSARLTLSRKSQESEADAVRPEVGPLPTGSSLPRAPPQTHLPQRLINNVRIGAVACS